MVRNITWRTRKLGLQLTSLPSISEECIAVPRETLLWKLQQECKLMDDKNHKLGSSNVPLTGTYHMRYFTISKKTLLLTKNKYKSRVISPQIRGKRRKKAPCSFSTTWCNNIALSTGSCSGAAIPALHIKRCHSKCTANHLEQTHSSPEPTLTLTLINRSQPYCIETYIGEFFWPRQQTRL